jgi:hypothetical protein
MQIVMLLSPISEQRVYRYSKNSNISNGGDKELQEHPQKHEQDETDMVADPDPNRWMCADRFVFCCTLTKCHRLRQKCCSYGILRHSTAFYIILHHFTALYGILWHFTVFYGMLGHSTAFYGIFGSSTAWQSDTTAIKYIVLILVLYVMAFTTHIFRIPAKALSDRTSLHSNNSAKTG